MKLSFIGSSHIAYWILDKYFADQEYQSYGVPGAGIEYIERFRIDVKDTVAIIMIGTNDLYMVNDSNMEQYAERYINAICNITTVKTYLVSILPRNDYPDSTPLNGFISRLNSVIRPKAESRGIQYIDVFPFLLKGNHLDDDLTFDDLHLNDKGYDILSKEVRQALRI